jgi:hypothetical protein
MSLNRALLGGNQLSLHNELNRVPGTDIEARAAACATLLVDGDIAVQQGYGSDRAGVDAGSTTRAALSIYPYCLDLGHLCLLTLSI